MENKKKSKIGSGGELLTCSGESCAVFGVNFKKRKPTSKKDPCLSPMVSQSQTKH